VGPFLLLAALQRRKEMLQDSCQLAVDRRPFASSRICNDIQRRETSFGWIACSVSQEEVIRTDSGDYPLG